MIRRLYLDSRINASGIPSDFTVQLPQEVQVKKGQALVLGSMTMANVFEAIQKDYSDVLYFRADESDDIMEGINNRIYFRVRTFQD